MSQPYYSLLELLFLMSFQISVSNIARVCSASLLILLVTPFAVCIIYIPVLHRCLLSPVLHSPGGVDCTPSSVQAACIHVHALVQNLTNKQTSPRELIGVQ